MRPKPLLVLIAFYSLTALASPGLSDEGKADDAAGPIAAMVAPASCATLAIGTPQPLFMTCTVQVECNDGTVKFCSGNSSCSTSGINHRCVTCDGIQQGCCPVTCCEDCAASLATCEEGCIGSVCNACYRGYRYCVDNCTGGCPCCP